ncbi:MAG: glycosyltransferase [Clostridia bacterium]|nr:glycosyltransferase [Clostridia bacterium]
MKVIQINCVYGRGSTGVLTRDLHESLMARGDESLVIYGRGKKVREQGVLRLGSEILGKFGGARARLTGIMYGGCELETAAVISNLKAEKPNVVHLQCINGNFVNIFRLITFLKNEGIPTVITLHAEFMYTANCSHAYDCEKWITGCGGCPELRKQTHSMFVDRTARCWARMKEAFDGFRRLIVVPVSPWQEARVRRSPFFDTAEVHTIMNGVDLNVFHPMGKKNASSARRILYVTPHFDKSPGSTKGGEHLYPLAERLSDKVRISAVGPGDWGTPPANVEIIGPVWERRELARLYAESDLTLLTSKRETFSMVTAESLCCGTPVVGFRAGGPESIALPNYSRFCEPGDIEELAGAVMEIDIPEPRVVAEKAGACYNKERTICEYLNTYQKVRDLL